MANRALIAIGLVVVIFGVVVPGLGSVSGGGSGCAYGGVTSVTTSSNAYDTNSQAGGSGTVGGSCPAAGDTVYWSMYAYSSGTGGAGGAQVTDGIASVKTGNVFSFSFTTPAVQGTYVIWASLCSNYEACTTPGISGTAQTPAFNVLSNTPGLTTYKGLWTLESKTTASPIVDVTTFLYSSAGTLVGTNTTGSNGEVSFPGLEAGTYSLSWFPTVGAYEAGSQAGFTVGAGDLNAFDVFVAGAATSTSAVVTYSTTTTVVGDTTQTTVIETSGSVTTTAITTIVGSSTSSQIIVNTQTSTVPTTVTVTGTLVGTSGTSTATSTSAPGTGSGSSASGPSWAVVAIGGVVALAGVFVPSGGKSKKKASKR